MTARTYDELFAREKPHLWIAFDTSMDATETLRWNIRDLRTGDLYARAATYAHALAFMRAAERQGDATIDETSLTMCRMLLDGGFSVRVPSSQGGPLADADSPELPVTPAIPGGEPAPLCDPFTNVIQLRKDIA